RHVAVGLLDGLRALEIVQGIGRVIRGHTGGTGLDEPRGAGERGGGLPGGAREGRLGGGRAQRHRQQREQPQLCLVHAGLAFYTERAAWSMVLSVPSDGSVGSVGSFFVSPNFPPPPLVLPH